MTKSLCLSMLPLLVAALFIPTLPHAARAQECCKPGAECCKPEAECCKPGRHAHGAPCCEGGCPMAEVAQSAQVTVEHTAQGAVLTLKAKSPADVKKVQALAQAMLEKMSAQAKAAGEKDCPHCHKGKKAK